MEGGTPNVFLPWDGTGCGTAVLEKDVVLKDDYCKVNPVGEKKGDLCSELSVPGAVGLGGTVRRDPEVEIDTKSSSESLNHFHCPPVLKNEVAELQKLKVKQFLFLFICVELIMSSN